MVFTKNFRLTKKKEDTAYVFRQLKLIKNRKDSDKPKKMRIYHIQVKSNASQKDIKFPIGIHQSSERREL